MVVVAELVGLRLVWIQRVRWGLQEVVLAGWRRVRAVG
jgi:hypothetical protein